MAQVQNTISSLLCACCTITIKRCKLLIYRAAPQRCGSVDLSENSWALLPCGEEIKTLQTPMYLQFYSLLLRSQQLLQWPFKCANALEMLWFLHKFTLNQHEISTKGVKLDKDNPIKQQRDATVGHFLLRKEKKIQYHLSVSCGSERTFAFNIWHKSCSKNCN